MEDMVDETSPWSVSADEFRGDAPPETQFEFLLRYAILAPSSHNTQPWYFSVDEGGIDVYADTDRWLPVADADRRELFISVGCALENLLVAAERFGFDHDVTYTSATTGDGASTADDRYVHVARVVLATGGSRSALRGGLFEVLTERSTNHGPYHGTVSAAIREDLASAVTDPDLWIRFVEGETKAALGALVTRADHRQFEDADYRRELGEWIGNGALEPSWLKAKLGQLVVTHLDIGDRQAAADSVLVESAPVVVVLGSTADTTAARVRVGQAFERLALLATAEGLSVHPMSQVLELPDVRDELERQLDVDAGVVQHLFRLGYAEPEGGPSSRRPLADVVD